MQLYLPLKNVDGCHMKFIDDPYTIQPYRRYVAIQRG